MTLAVADVLVSGEVLAATLRIAAPLILAALGGMLCERSGVINIGLEGMMLVGAFGTVAGAHLAGAAGAIPAVALIAGLTLGLTAGALAALIHAWVSVGVQADQIISGLAINLLAVGATRLGCKLLFDSESNSPAVEALAVGTVLGLAPAVWLALALVPACWWALFRTPFGLRLRAVGEHPHAAATLGVGVRGLRVRAVVASGVLAGLAGASLALDVQQFVTQMTAGRGYIALAALIFGRWHPGGVLLAALIFAYPDAAARDLGRALGQQGVELPGELIRALPYLVTLIALAGFVGTSRPPAAIGRPYDEP